MREALKVGAVLYDPKVSTIWEIIREFFEANGCKMDVQFYSTYELQVDDLAAGKIDIAWNSPLAWLDSERRVPGGCEAIAMRDTDRDRVSHWVVKSDSGFESLDDLQGKAVATGAKDSPQATLIPLGMLQAVGLEPGTDFEVKRHDVLIGKHGDHIGGEQDALNALTAGEAAASAMLDLNWQRWSTDGTIDPNRYKVLATTPLFDHCVFTVPKSLDPGRKQHWLETLFQMTYDNPDHREMMDLEGLKEWLPGRTSGFGPLTRAVKEQDFFG